MLAVRDLSFSCGVASLAPGQRPAHAFRAADAAQYAAKRAGRGLVAVAGEREHAWTPAPGRRGARDRTPEESRALAAALLATLEPAPADERLERLATALHRLA
jgi:hypothetical protein